MRDSGLEWVAHIPEHWGTPPLGANFDVQLGKMLNQEAAATGEQFLYLRNVNVQWDHLEVDDMAAMHFDAADRIRYALQDGDLLVCEGGEVGRAAIWHGELADCYYQKALHRVRPRGDDNSRFLMYALWAAASCGVFENEGNTSTFVHLTAEKLRAHRFPWPPLSERRAISDYLDVETARVDALVSARKRQAGLLDARIETERESLFQALRERYGVVALKRLSDRVEQGWSPECDAVPAEAGEWGVLKTSAVSSGSFDRTENKRLPVTIEPDPRWIIRDGDLLVVRGSGSPSAVGQAAVAEVVSANLLLSDLLYRVRLLDANPAFVAAALRSRYGRGQLEASIRTDVGMTRKIRSDDLAGVLVPAAPRSAQDAAVEALRRQEDRLASLRRRLSHQVDLLVERRQALITAAVTGQIEIPGVAA